MFKVNSLGTWMMNDGRTVFEIKSPVSADRNNESMMAAIGQEIEIDGVVYNPAGFVMSLPLTPVRVGEQIGVVVRCERLAAEARSP